MRHFPGASLSPRPCFLHISRIPLLVSLFLFLAVAPALALVPMEVTSSLSQKAFRNPELQVSTASDHLEKIRHQLPDPQSKAIERFKAKHGRDFQFHLDPRSGAPTSVVGAIPVIPGSGRDNHISHEDVGKALGEPVATVDGGTVSRVIRKFLLDNQDVMNLDGTQLGSMKTELVGDQVWQVHATQEVNGIKVRGAGLAATVGHGNLILFGTERWGKVHVNTVPKIKGEEALKRGFEYAGGRVAADRIVAEPGLEIVPVAPRGLQDGDRYVGPMGKGYDHRLVWTFSFRRGPEIPTWEVMVDADSGEVLSFLDLNQYATSSITGAVYPLTNTGICPAYTCCGSITADMPMPFANTGLPSPNDFTNSAGLFSYDSGKVGTSLYGKYVRINDFCGHVREEVYGSAGINLGGANNDHDCVSAGASPGNTAAARTAFYELNRVMESARSYVPGRPWLQQPLVATVNLDDICNAYWDTETVTFFRSGAGCGNTGELAGVFDHEWGHGLDYNDLNHAGSNPGEAYADVVAMYRLQTSCIGYGFFDKRDQGCGETADGSGHNTNLIHPYFGKRCALNCSGVRETDWAQLTNPPDTPDTPANYACTKCLAATYGGPCGRQVHCESAVDTQAAWDFVARDLQSPPFSYDATTAFLMANRIFYKAAGNIGDWHTCSCTGSTSNGCGATNAYMQWLAADDDDGDISNGTPHMTALYNAFNRHGIACDTPAPVNSGCSGAPTLRPVVTLAPEGGQVGLSWTGVPSASRYGIYRSEGASGCSTGKTPIATVTGSTFTDTGLANGMQYCYTILALGASEACSSPAGTCICTTLASAPTGTLQGTVTDASNGTPVAGALVTIPGGYADTTGASGAFRIVGLPAATFSVTVSALGHEPQTVAGVQIWGGETTNRDLVLLPRPLVTVQGTVVDGSGHGWPLYATLEITAPGYAALVQTDRQTGSYSIPLHAGATYQFKVSSPGYSTATRQLTPSTGGSTENFQLTVDPSTCAPGYGSLYLETFENGPGGYAITKKPATYTDGFSTWEWGTPVGYPGSAHSGSRAWGTNLSGFYWKWENGYITSPPVDLSRNAGQASILSWWQWLEVEEGFDVPSVEVSKDGGATWTIIYQEYSQNFTSWTLREVELDPSYSAANFRIRFHFVSDTYVEYPGWYVDDVSVRPQSGCQLVAGGLLVGNVYDRGTGSGLSDAKVSAGAGKTAATAATPRDPGLDDGYYTLFLPTGSHAVTASAPGYLPQGATAVTITANAITRQDFSIVKQLSLGTGELTPAATGQSYNHSMSVSGGVPPYTWTVTSGSLPAGLTLNGTAGTISGTPVAAGRTTLTMEVADSLGSTGSKPFTLTVHPTVMTHVPVRDGVAQVSSALQVTFSDVMDPATINPDSIILSNDGGPTIAMAGGGAHSLLLRADGTVFEWGVDLLGIRQVPAGLSGVTAITAGAYFSLALKSDGTVAAWGYDDYGQVEVPSGLTGVIGISSRNFHALALKGDGTVVAWGGNDSNQTRVPKDLKDVVSVAAGGHHSLALRKDGTVVAWGWNGHDQSTVPEGLTGVVAIAAGYAHSLALKRDGTVVAWGSDLDALDHVGQATVPAGLAGVVAIAAGDSFSLALKGDGTLVFWGAEEGRPPAGLSGVIAVATGQHHGLALKADRSVVSWGANNYRQAVPPSYVNAREKGTVTYDAATRTATFTPLVPLTEGITYTATIGGVRSQTGVGLISPYSWNFRSYDLKITTFRLPAASVGTAFDETVRAVGGATPYSWSVPSGSFPPWATIDSGTGRISGTPTTGGTHSFTIQVTDAAGIAVTRGLTIATPPAITGLEPPDGAIVPLSAVAGVTFGEPVDPATVSIGTFFLSGNPPPRVIAAGERHSLVLREDGTVYAWGENYSEQASVPQGLSDVIAVAAGRFHSLALKGDGTVVAWGENNAGQATVPPGLTGVVAIAAGSSHSLALKNDGTVVAWGYNYEGQCDVPPALAGVIAIAAGTYHSLALKADGSVVAWGYGYKDGYGYSDVVNVPAKLTGVIAIAAGELHSIALKDDGRVVAWGSTGSLQSTVPDGLVDVVAIAAGTDFNLALKKDGTLVFWGVDTYGQSEVASHLNGVTAISASGGHSLALRRDNTVVDWDYLYGMYDLRAVPENMNGRVSGTVSYDAETRTATFTPSAPLAVGTKYFATLSNVKGESGGVTAPPFTWSFTTTDLRITTSALPDGTVGVPYAQTVSTAGGFAPLTWSIAGGTLPDGLALNPSTGAITGTPTVAGTSSITFRVTDSRNFTFTQTLDITVIPDSLTVTSTVLPDGYPTFPYNATLTAVAGTPPYRWSVAAGSLPGGLTLASDGSISGTSTAAGSANVTFRVTDAVNATADRTLTIAVKTRPTVTANLPANGAVVPVSATVQATFSEDLDPSTVSPATLTLSGWNGVTAMATSGGHVLAVKTDGSVAAWGYNHLGQATVPPGLRGVKAVAAGGYLSMALKSDGTVAVWGAKGDYVPAGLSGVTAMAAGFNHFLALKSDGTVVGWGEKGYGQIAGLAALTGVTAIAAGPLYSLALKSDGTVYATGTYQSSTPPTVPAGLTGVVAIAAGGYHCLALKDNGTVVAWGDNPYGQTLVPADLSRVIAIAAGEYYSLALKEDGTLVTWGWAPTMPAGLTGVTSIAAGGKVSMALKKDRSLVVWGDNWAGQTTLPESVTMPQGGTVSYDPGTRTATFTPSAPLAAGATYTASVAGGASQAGAPVEPFSWNFSTEGTALSITTGPFLSGTTRGRFDLALAATGGAAPYSWGIANGSLPAGLNLDPTTGAVTSTPTAAGISSVTFQVTDANGGIATRTVTIFISSFSLMRVKGVLHRYFDVLQSAYVALADGETIEMTGVDIYENVNFNRDVKTVLKGGYAADYSRVESETGICGSVTISKGTVVMDNVVLKP